MQLKSLLRFPRGRLLGRSRNGGRIEAHRQREDDQPLSVENAARRAEEFLRGVEPYPGGYAGRGIVTCAGGLRFNTCAWVLIKLLRHFGCILPIQAWYLGQQEEDPEWIELVRPLGVECVDAHQVRRQHPHPRLGGWELKPYAILHSPFREVLFLDADNAPLADPTYLFSEPAYQEAGAVLWPDPPHIRTRPDSTRWRVFGVPYRDEPEAESGQLLIDKQRCWRPLRLCNWYNRHSDFFYQHVHGDKDTFRFAWHRCGQRYAMTPYDLEELAHTLCQHDFHGRRIFQHRFNAKWSMFENLRITGFAHEDLCMEFLDELRRRWSPVRRLAANAEPADRVRTRELAGRCFDFFKPGYGHRPLALLGGGHLGRGGGYRHALWWIENGQLVLADGTGAEMCRLQQEDEVWRGVDLRRPGRSVRLSQSQHSTMG